MKLRNATMEDFERLLSNVNRRSDEMVEISAILVSRTHAAVLIQDADDKQHWLPLSQVEILEEKAVDAGEEPLVKLGVPEWLAIRKGLV